MTRRWLLVLIVAFMGLGVTYSLATPLFEAHDESSHLSVVRYLVVNHALPPRVTPAHRVTDSGLDMAWSLRFHDPPLYYAPPLYYTFAALLTAWTHMDDLPRLMIPNPSWEVGFAPRADTDPWNKNVYAHGAGETFATSETVRAAYVLRCLSLALGVVTIVCAYAVARLLFPFQPMVALGAAALVALNPHFIFLSSGVTNDTLLDAIFSLFLVGALTWMSDGASWKRWATLGGLAGLGVLTKQTALILLPLGGLAILWQPKVTWRKMMADSAAFGIVVLIVSGWWYTRGAILYGDPLGLETHFASQTPLASLGLKKVLMIFYSYWAAFGWKLILVEPAVYALAAVVMGAGLLGMILALWPRGAWTVWQLSTTTRRGLALLGAAVLLNLVGLVRWALATGAFDGRLLFPTLAATSVLIAWGLARLAQRRSVRYGLIVTTALAFLFAASVPWRYLRPAWASPRHAMPATARPTNADFRGVQLVGYQVSTEKLSPGSDFYLTLYWHVTSPPNRRLRTWVQLGPQDSTHYVAGQDVWLGGTLYPSELWQAGDTVRQIHRLAIPASAPAPGLYWVRLGLVESRLGQDVRLALTDGDDDTVVLGPWRTISASPDPVPSQKTDFSLGKTVRLVGYDLDQPKGELRLTLYWQARQAQEANYTVYMHVLDVRGRLIGQHDLPPRDGGYPTSWWLPGQIIVDQHTILLNEPYHGSATLLVGMYNPDTSERVPAYDSAGRPLPDAAIPLANIAIK